MSSRERSTEPQNRQCKEDETLSLSHDGKRDTSHVLEGHVGESLPAAQRGVDLLVNGDARPRK